MHTNDLNKRVSETLENFDNLTPIAPSKQWQEQVLSGIESARNQPAASRMPAGIISLMLFFVLLNTGYFLTAYFHRTSTSDNRSEELQTISSELLINPSSVTN